MDAQRLPFQVIEYTARRADDDVRAVGQSIDLWLHWGAAVNANDVELRVLSQRLELFGYLQRELTRWAQDQRLTALFAGSHARTNERHAEGGGFSGSGSGLNDAISALDCGGVDGCR